MKKTILSVLILLFAFYNASAQVKPLSLSGNVEGVSGGKVYLQKFDDKVYHVIDSVNIVNGKFSFSTEVELPEVYGLSLNLSKNPLMLFLDNNPVSVKLDPSSNYRNSVVTGSAEHDLYLAYRKKDENEDVKIDEFIKNNPKSLAATYILYREFAYRLSPEQIRANITLLDPSLHKTQYVRVLEDLVKTMEAVSVGKKAPDFTAKDTDGNPVRLSDHLGKGYVLIDFWASWCGPCRRENPNILKAYNQYKDKGFDIFAVSLDQSKTSWLTAIGKDNLTWTHVSDLLYWNSAPAKLYGVRAIPANFLVDSNGIIVAKNIRGEELGKTLETLLK